jgi:hypothetical protein
MIIVDKFQLVMPARSRSKNGVLSTPYVAGIHVFLQRAEIKDVDGRDKPGHDGVTIRRSEYYDSANSPRSIVAAPERFGGGFAPPDMRRAIRPTNFSFSIGLANK